MLRKILIEVLRDSELSQGEIARQMGISSQQITNWKNGSAKIRFESLQTICEITGCKISIDTK